MSQFPVRYKVYASDGVTLIYTFTFVQNDTLTLPTDSMDYAEIEGLRGQGSLIIPGSTQAFDAKIEFYLQGTDYSSLMSAIDTFQTTVALQTKYVLKVDRTINSTQSYNVMRLKPLEIKDSGDFRTGFELCTATFRINSW